MDPYKPVSIVECYNGCERYSVDSWYHLDGMVGLFNGCTHLGLVFWDCQVMTFTLHRSWARMVSNWPTFPGTIPLCPGTVPSWVWLHWDRMMVRWIPRTTVMGHKNGGRVWNHWNEAGLSSDEFARHFEKCLCGSSQHLVTRYSEHYGAYRFVCFDYCHFQVQKTDKKFMTALCQGYLLLNKDERLSIGLAGDYLWPGRGVCRGCSVSAATILASRSVWSFRVSNSSRWWFQIFFVFTSIWGRFPFWRAYFSDGLVQPPTWHWKTQKKSKRKEGRSWWVYKTRLISSGKMCVFPISMASNSIASTFVWYLTDHKQFRMFGTSWHCLANEKKLMVSEKNIKNIWHLSIVFSCEFETFLDMFLKPLCCFLNPDAPILPASGFWSGFWGT